jgi:hypothetical protein
MSSRSFDPNRRVSRILRIEFTQDLQPVDFAPIGTRSMEGSITEETRNILIQKVQSYCEAGFSVDVVRSDVTLLRLTD